MSGTSIGTVAFPSAPVLQKVSDNHYVLAEVGDMRVEAHAFLSLAQRKSSTQRYAPPLPL